MIELTGYVPHKQAITQMMGASMLLMAIPDTPDNKGIVTGKFFEYLASGRPVLAIGPTGGDIEIMLLKCRAGRLISYNETEEMQQFILEIFDREKKGETWHETVNTEMFTRKNLTRELSGNL